MFKCPHCGKETISIWKKLTLDPRYKYKCDDCDGKINIPYMLYITFCLLLLVVVYILKVNIKLDWGYTILITILVAILLEVINVLFVPIIKG